MENRSLRQLAAVGLVALLALAVGASGSLAQEKLKTPEPGVPELFTLEGEFVRVAYNNEGYVSLGYRMANQSVGGEWMLLEMGATVRIGVKDRTLKRGALSLDTPHHASIPLASQEEYMKANLSALDLRSKTIPPDNISYFPPGVTGACRIGFFADVGRTRANSFDQVDLSSRRGCLGRIYFHVPGGIKHGQHWLNVQFEKSLVRVPFRILTKEEETGFYKKWKDIKKEHEKAFKK
ncbi:MAG: hypothetical protein V3T24_12180 [Longimicrobiales bacterium]